MPVIISYPLWPQEKQDRIRHYAEILVPVKVGHGVDADGTMVHS